MSAIFFPLSFRFSDIFILLFSAKPRFLQKPRDLIINEGRKAAFKCFAEGKPAPTVFWQRKGSSSHMFANHYYRDSRFYVTRSGNLEISVVKKEDEGAYTCMALNLAGMASVEAHLTVIGEFTFKT